MADKIDIDERIKYYTAFLKLDPNDPKVVSKAYKLADKFGRQLPPNLKPEDIKRMKQDVAHALKILLLAKKESEQQ